MGITRRDFVQRSASSAALAALAPGAAAVTGLVPEPAAAADARARGVEAKFIRAHPVPLERVRLTGGPLKHAQESDAKYLLSLDPDRMMAYYRVRAGLAQKAAPYDNGWDGGGRNLTGHIAGHHLSAVSLMYRATGDERFKQRASYLVSELKVVQDKNGDGYLSALEHGREAFGALSKGEIRSAAFDLNGLWSPWYTLHKTFAGLRDAYRYTGNATALDVEAKFAGWAERVLEPLDAKQVARMLNTEHGGMNEVLADLYADTGDKRWLVLSYRFEHHEFTDALKRGQDNLNGKHGNCQIPKLIGSAARYTYTGDPGDLMAASFFWDRVTEHHSYSTGGHGLSEYFGPPDVLGSRVDGRTCESCNVYNMLKLTRRMFSIRPDAYYADFHERALFNHALASFDPDDVRMSYMVPVGRGVQQEYQDMQRSFTCCVGTGMENHALHGHGIYYESPDTAWVNIFAPSTAQLTNGMRLQMDSDFPDGDSATITISSAPSRPFTLAVRRPSWAGDGFKISVNGTPVPQPPIASLRAGGAGGRDIVHDDRFPQPSTFVELTRAWKNGDKIELSIPKTVRLEPTPDDRSVAAIMWGPLVLVGNLGARREGRMRTADESAVVPVGPAAVPMLVAAGNPVSEWVVPSGDRKGDFRAQQVARVPASPGAVGDVSLTPFYRTHGRTYSAHFDVVSQEQFDSRVAALEAEKERVRRLEAATIGFVQPGDTNSEKPANYQSDPANRLVVRAIDKSSRGGPGWFSFELPVDPAADTAVVVTYLNERGLAPARGNFEILVDGTSIGRFEPNEKPVGFFDATYHVPANLTRGKTKVTIRFQAEAPNGRIAPVFGVRTARADKM
ncbi:MAG TPA: beta-L-arabinofuranosidase domain-containing protein [Gemmatimonadaceae bacterium]|nr:beta-L-arabinofuranosidase domain-containing protein [Gemmatimonadaceae bacterium]